MKSIKKPVGLLLPVVVIIIWQIVSVLSVINPILLPSPVSVFSTLFRILFTGEIFNDIAMTLGRTFAGFFLAVVIGVPLGLLMGYHKKVYSYLGFMVDFLIGIPHIALFPLFLLLFGVGDEAKIMVVVLASSLFILVNTMYGIRYANKLRIITSKVMKVSRFDMFRKVMIMEAIPYIFAGMKM